MLKAIPVVEVVAKKDQVKSRDMEHVADSLEAPAFVAVVSQWTTKRTLKPEYRTCAHPSSRSLHFSDFREVRRTQK